MQVRFDTGQTGIQESTNLRRKPFIPNLYLEPRPPKSYAKYFGASFPGGRLDHRQRAPERPSGWGPVRWRPRQQGMAGGSAWLRESAAYSRFQSIDVWKSGLASVSAFGLCPSPVRLHIYRLPGASCVCRFATLVSNCVGVKRGDVKCS